MSVNWLWKEKVGEITFKNLKDNQKWKLEMFTGNMMCCFIYRYKQFNEETKKFEKFYNFFTWFNDIKHARRVLKDAKLEDLPLGEHKVLNIKIYVNRKDAKYSNNEMLKFAKLLVEHKYKVILK